MAIFRKYEKSEVIPIAVLIAVYFISATMLFMQYMKSRDLLIRDLSEEKLITARYAARELFEFLEHERVALDNIAGQVSITGSLEKGKTALETFAATHRRRPRLYTFNVTDSRGRFLYSVPEDLEGRYLQDLSGQNFFRETIKKKKFVNAGASADSKGEWHLVMAAPVFSRDGHKILGVISEKIGLAEIASRFIVPVDAGKGGYVFLLDESGRLLATQNESRLYQIEGSSGTLKRMLGGEEGVVIGRSEETDKEELTVFSPVSFQGRTWTVGIIVPSLELYDEAKINLWRIILIITLMTLVFSWSLVSVTQSSKYKAGIEERTRFSEYLLQRNRELSALNDFSRTISAGEDLDSLLEKAVNTIVAETGAKGCAVRLSSVHDGQLNLKNNRGMSEDFTRAGVCKGGNECACTKAISSGMPIFLNRDMEAGRPACNLMRDGELAVIPLIVKKKSLGILYVWRPEEGMLTEEGEKFLTAFGNQLAITMENVLQMEDTKRYAARASALFNTAQALTRGLTMDELLEIIMKEAASLLKVRRSMLFLYKEEENLIECRVALGFTHMLPNELAFNPSGIFWEAMRDGGIKTVNAPEMGQQVPRRFMDKAGLDRFLLVPLLSKGKVLGFIVLEMAEKSKAALEDLKMVMGFSNQAAVAIETSSFYIRTIEKYNEDLQELSNRILAAQEEERKRISRDLHDELGQGLTAIKINLDMISSNIPPDFVQLKNRINDAVKMVSSTLDSVRKLSFELRPSMLDDLGLVTVLSRLVSDFQARTGLKVKFDHEEAAGRLSQEIEVTLYRVVQEALTNIIKHSKAENVDLALKYDESNGIVFLKVEDDGVGIPDKEVKEAKGFGLIGIRERVSLLGGNFRIFSQKDSGTKIFIDIPYSKGETKSW